MKNFVPKGKLLKLNISIFFNERNKSTHQNQYSSPDEERGGAGEQVGFGRSFGGGIVWFLGEMEGDQSSPTELKEGGGA